MSADAAKLSVRPVPSNSHRASSSDFAETVTVNAAGWRVDTVAVTVAVSASPGASPSDNVSGDTASVTIPSPDGVAVVTAAGPYPDVFFAATSNAYAVPLLNAPIVAGEPV